MTKLHTFIEKLRKDEAKFALFLHDLAHELNPEEVELIAIHSNAVWTKEEEAPKVTEEQRLDNIAKELERLAGQVRTGEIPVPTGEVTATIAFEVTK